jgi:hypothetical protein
MGRLNTQQVFKKNFGNSGNAGLFQHPFCNDFFKNPEESRGFAPEQ